MTQAPRRLSALVRVSVTSGSRRVDLVVPGAVPVAELVPELARSVGLLDAVTAYAGYRLVTRGGRELVGDAGLTVQGVADGDVITVAARVDDPPVRVYDDLVEAMTDAVERDLVPWDAAAGRRVMSGATVLILLVLAASLLLLRASDVAAAAAVMVAVVLVLGAVVLSRTGSQTGVAVAGAWVGSVFAAVAGLTFACDAPFVGTPVAAAGGGALLAGLVATLGFAGSRTLLLPPVVVGAVFLATGVLVRGTSYDLAVVLTTALTLVVLAGSAFPSLALGAAGAFGDPDAIDAARLAADARVAHEILVAVSSAVGVLLVLVAPLAVSLGVGGALVSVLACLVVMLRPREYRAAAEALVGHVSRVLGLAATAAAALLLRPAWRPATAAALAVSGAVLLALTLLPRAGSVRRARLGDLVETAALLALPSTLVVASGVCSSLRGWA
jgi:hypothetical protein